MVAPNADFGASPDGVEPKPPKADFGASAGLPNADVGADDPFVAVLPKGPLVADCSAGLPKVEVVPGVELKPPGAGEGVLPNALPVDDVCPNALVVVDV